MGKAGFLLCCLNIWLMSEAILMPSSTCVTVPAFSNCSCIKSSVQIIADCSHLRIHVSPIFTPVVQIVNLSFNELEHGPVPGSLPTGLQRLDLSHNKIKFFPASAFDGLYSLQILNISSNHLALDESTFFKGVFADLKTLWHLEMQNNSRISSNHSTNMYPGSALQGLMSLRSLSIDGLPSYKFGKEFSKLQNLSQLNLSSGYCNLSVYGLTETYFKNLPDLQVLNVNNCLIKNIHNNTFSPLQNLTYLDISNNNLLTLCGLKNASDGLIRSSIKIFKANRIYCAVGKSTFVSRKFFKSLR